MPKEADKEEGNDPDSGLPSDDRRAFLGPAVMGVVEDEAEGEFGLDLADEDPPLFEPDPPPLFRPEDDSPFPGWLARFLSSSAGFSNTPSIRHTSF